MNQIDLNKLLNRENDVSNIKNILKEFELNKNNLLFKKGIYVYGDPGTGKTTFVTNILKEMDYDIIKYDAGDIRNKAIIDTITKHNMSDKNIISIFNKKIKKIAIIMDEIDGMNNGDKGGINTLIKLIRPKKTKKQKQEEITMNPIICIGNHHVDKKIKELIKVCNTIELKTPNPTQIKGIISGLLPDINADMSNKFTDYVQGDLRKLNNIYNIYLKNPDILNSEVIKNIFHLKSYNDDTKKIIHKLLSQPYNINDHLTLMNETDRTIVGLLWHENLIDGLEKVNKKESIPFYLNQLENICFADYIDRITFQKQIWQFNEMSSLIKTFKNNKLYHPLLEKVEQNNENNKQKNSTTEEKSCKPFAPLFSKVDKVESKPFAPLFSKVDKVESKPFAPLFSKVDSDIRFTKVLTKYSTEYNNSLFIQNLCQQLAMDKRDLFSFFMELKNKYDDNQILALFENIEISKLDINRIYRYLEKYTKENAQGEDEKEIDEDDIVDININIDADFEEL
jgi:DNA polymerase III delta prime subunit